MNAIRHIPFHQPTFLGEELNNLIQCTENSLWVIENKESKQFFINLFPCSTCFFTNSCSSALEIAIKALNLQQGDEVIIPGYGYVAVANAVVNNSAIPVFADVELTNGNIDSNAVSRLITPKTKAVIAIHYAGVPFAIDNLLEVCNEHKIWLIEDAAQCLGSQYNNKPLGAFGHIACISFDYMKNVTCGQGGLLIVNDPSLLPQIQSIVDNGTNKQWLLDGSQQHFDWISKGNNCQINPIATHFILPQLNALEMITASRIQKWKLYHQLLLPLEHAGKIKLPQPVIGHNGHIFFLRTNTEIERTTLKQFLLEKGIRCEQHYSSLASSTFGEQFAQYLSPIPNAELLCANLLRLPLWHTIHEDDIRFIAQSIHLFFAADRSQH